METTPVGFSLMELRGEEQLSNALSPILCLNMASAICSMKPSRSLVCFALAHQAEPLVRILFGLMSPIHVLPHICSKVS